MFNRIKRNILVRLMGIIENSRDIYDMDIKHCLQNALTETPSS